MKKLLIFLSSLLAFAGVSFSDFRDVIGDSSFVGGKIFITGDLPAEVLSGIDWTGAPSVINTTTLYCVYAATRNCTYSWSAGGQNTNTTLQQGNTLCFWYNGTSSTFPGGACPTLASSQVRQGTLDLNMFNVPGTTYPIIINGYTYDVQSASISFGSGITSTVVSGPPNLQIELESPTCPTCETCQTCVAPTCGLSVNSSFLGDFTTVSIFSPVSLIATDISTSDAVLTVEEVSNGSGVCEGSGDVAEQLAILNGRMQIQTETPSGFTILTQEGVIDQKSNLVLPSGLTAYNTGENGDMTVITFLSGQELTYLQPLTGAVLEATNELGGDLIYVFFTIIGFVLLGFVLVKAFTSFKGRE